MICTYRSGEEFLADNRELLAARPQLSGFFFLDAPLLARCDRANYALCAECGEERLLALKVEPYALLLFGEKAPAAELAEHLVREGYEMTALMGEKALCDHFTALLSERHGVPFVESLPMDSMEARGMTELSDAEVSVPTEEELPQILAAIAAFIRECGLRDRVDAEKERATLRRFRILREDGRIVSMAKYAPDGETKRRISDVYTLPEYRGRGYARRVVNTLKNEILEEGYTATLNVDRRNPISNHLYASLGFVRIFSQSEYRRVAARDS